jgi:creatinine amidohydrolase/Fe(II)-dependent formamide hydrolase-like protein
MTLVCPLFGSCSAQIYQLAEMNTEQIKALHRERTVILLPGGILEEHGPYLPAYTDGYAIEALTRDLAQAISMQPGWAAVIFPQIPLGHNGANAIGSKYSFPGTYTVRHETLRAVYMDLSSEFGEQGFQWIFIIHNHGDPDHNRALDEASDYFHDVYGGTMVHLLGLQPLMECCGSKDKLLTPAQLKEEGLSVHAGVEETSQMLFLRPGLVGSGYRAAPSWTAKDFPEMYELASRPNWTGYFGAPKFATIAEGAQEFHSLSGALQGAALKILAGQKWREIPRFADSVDPRDEQGQREAEQYGAAIAKKQSTWLEAHRLNAKQ